MILIADSGSTKTDWVLTNKYGIELRFSSSGINPYYMDLSQIQGIIDTEVLSSMEGKTPDEVYFYGAGCSSSSNIEKIKTGFKPAFGDTPVTVNHDLLGAARSMCQDRKGIIGILGTGANSGLYDGEKIIDNVPSLGYVLGDEGSGSHMGRLLVASYFQRAMPEDIKVLMEQQFDMSRDHILSKVYKAPMASAYLGQFAIFLSENIDHPFARDIVHKSLSEFFSGNIDLYDGAKELPLYFVGSVAHHFKSMMSQIADENDYLLAEIAAEPLTGLARFHILADLQT